MFDALPEKGMDLGKIHIKLKAKIYRVKDLSCHSLMV